jgi:hypothetical protein
MPQQLPTSEQGKHHQHPESEDCCRNSSEFSIHECPSGRIAYKFDERYWDSNYTAQQAQDKNARRSGSANGTLRESKCKLGEPSPNRRD